MNSYVVGKKTTTSSKAQPWRDKSVSVIYEVYETNVTTYLKVAEFPKWPRIRGVDGPTADALTLASVFSDFMNHRVEKPVRRKR